MTDALTQPEIYALATGHCPDCSGDEFHHGPRGGLARNYGCARCGAAFNLALVGDPAQLVSAQRIPRLVVDVDQLERGPLPAAGYDMQAGARAAYHDPNYPERPCDRCGKSYNGPAVYCSIECAIADA